MTDRNPDRICFWDSEVTPKGKLELSCRRLALPGRMVCHHHAPMIKRRKKSREKIKAVRAARRMTRGQ